MNWGDQVVHGQSMLNDRAVSQCFVSKYNFQMPSSLGTDVMF